MGNIELKEAFKNVNANAQGRTLALDLMSDEKLVNDLYSYVANTIVGSADKVKIDKLFPDSNVQSQSGAQEGEGMSLEEVMKS